MSALAHSLSDVKKHYQINRIRNSEGNTPEEIYDSMDLLGVEKPPREEFIAKVNENIPKYGVYRPRMGRFRWRCFTCLVNPLTNVSRSMFCT